MHKIQKGNSIECNPNTWWLDHLGNVDMKCPNGHIGSLKGHNIDVNGIVTPSIDCGGGSFRPECDFHVFGVLENYKD